jgi:predicted transcriptional regulator
MDEFEIVDAKFAKNLSEGLTIRLDPDTLAKIRTLAKKKGIGPTTLIRMWILEDLEKVEKQQAAQL